MANKAKTPEQIKIERFDNAEAYLGPNLLNRVRDSGYKNEIPKPPKSITGIGGYEKRLNEWHKQLKELEFQLRVEQERKSNPNIMTTQL